MVSKLHTGAGTCKWKRSQRGGTDRPQAIHFDMNCAKLQNQG